MIVNKEFDCSTVRNTLLSDWLSPKMVPLSHWSTLGMFSTRIGPVLASVEPGLDLLGALDVFAGS